MRERDWEREPHMSTPGTEWSVEMAILPSEQRVFEVSGGYANRGKKFQAKRVRMWIGYWSRKEDGQRPILVDVSGPMLRKDGSEGLRSAGTRFEKRDLIDQMPVTWMALQGLIAEAMSHAEDEFHTTVGQMDRARS